MSTFLFSTIYSTPGDVTIYPPAGATGALFRCIGGGGGACVWASPISPKSGGGAAYAATTLGGGIGLATVTPGVGIPAHVGAGGVGGSYIYHFPGEDTWVGNSNYLSGACLCLANGANQVSSISAGNYQISKGDVKFSGGGGLINTLDYGPGASGGGAGGPNGAGANGQGSADGTIHAGDGNGGNADNGHGGLGGIWVDGSGTQPPAASGGNGSEITVTTATGTVILGSGGGGAGATPSGTGGTARVSNGGSGGLYGGGGGIGTGANFGTAFGGNGAQGIIIVDWYGTLPTYAFKIPACIGATYVSQGQILRPATPQEAGTLSGPAQGKLRRIKKVYPLLYSAQGVQVGVDFFKMTAVPLLSAGNTQPLFNTQLYSGVAQVLVTAEFNRDNMFCWQITRPYPCTMVAVECHLETIEDN